MSSGIVSCDVLISHYMFQSGRLVLSEVAINGKKGA